MFNHVKLVLGNELAALNDTQTTGISLSKKKNGKITLTKEQMRGAVITSHCELSVVEGCLIDAVNQNYFQSRNPGNLVVVFISNKEREKKSIHPGLVVMRCGLGAIQYSCLVLLISFPIFMKV